MEVVHRIIGNYRTTLWFMCKFTFWRDIDMLVPNKSHASLDMFVTNLFKRSEISLTVAGDANQLVTSLERVIETDWVHNVVFNHNRKHAEFIREVVDKFTNRAAFEMHHAIHDESVQLLNNAIFFIKHTANFIVLVFTGSLTIDSIFQFTPDAL